MSGQVERILSIAEKYTGTKESPMGSNNVMFNTAYYGKAVNGPEYQWCGVFVWYVFNEAGLAELFYGGGKTASCTVLMNYAKAHGQFVKSGFKQGDLALFNWDGGKNVAHHVGIVTGAGDGYVLTIEGNTSISSDSNGGEVMTRRRSAGYVLGAYRPEYKEDEMDAEKLKTELTSLAGTGGGHSGWAGDAITELTGMGVFNGDGEGNYGWGQLVTRETLAQVIYNLIKLTGIGEEGKIGN